jgi:hypothetical protein
MRKPGYQVAMAMAMGPVGPLGEELEGAAAEAGAVEEAAAEEAGRAAAAEAEGFEAEAQAAAGETTVLQTGGNKITGRIADGLNKGTGESLTKREWGRALEALKRDNGLRNDAHGKILSNGDFVVNGTTIGNITHYIP